jgi:hypothetical protein
VIDDITRALVDHVQDQSPDLGEWVVIHSLSAADPEPDRDRLVACLLAVDEHDVFRNSPVGPGFSGGGRPELQLRLHYLFSYVGPHEVAMNRIARLVEVLHSSPVLGAGQLPASLADRVERLTVRLHNTTAAEREEVWSALGRPGRLAVFYDVDVVPRVG